MAFKEEFAKRKERLDKVIEEITEAESEWEAKWKNWRKSPSN